VAGVTTLQVLPGTSLVVTGNSSGVRMGRGMGGDAVGSSKGVIVQTGGTVRIDGSNGLRLSQADTGTIADSLYEISGGKVVGGANVGALTASLNIGNTGATYGLAEFHVIGSGLSASPRFVDVALGGSTVGTGIARLHFTLDNGGVTPIIAEDELQFRYNNSLNGVNSLVVDLAGLPPLTDITLIKADRLNRNTTPAGSTETFTGMPDGTDVSASFGGFTYNWKLRYMDGSDNFTGDDAQLDAFVKLQFISQTAVPEMSAFVFMGAIACSTIAIRRMRRLIAV
jgi:hypothetical protein